MKNIINIILIILLFVNITSAQTSWILTGNTPASTDFLGSLSGNNQPVNIKNEDNQPINFYTNAGSGTFNNQRAIITGGGNVGIGLTSPQNLLHQHIGSASATYHQFTNSSTTSGSGDGLLLGIDANDNAIYNMQENKGHHWLTNGGTPQMKLTSSGDLLIGNYNSFTINSQLVQYDGNNTSTYHQFLASNTNTATTDGFKIGITIEIVLV